MKTYPENYQVVASVGFTDLNGDAVIPTAVNAALYDGDDELVVDFGSLPFVVADGKKDVVIAAAFNILGAGELEAARILRTELVTAEGSVRRSFSYIIAGETRLELMVNTFLTMEAAELMVRNMPNMSGWANADEEKRYAALIESFNRMTRIPMKYGDEELLVDVDPRDRLLVRTETVITREAWLTLDAAGYAAFPAAFKKALRTAQITEANEILEGDEYGRRHRAGVISETVGESSVMLRGGAIDYGVSALSMKALAGYIFFNYRVVRS